MNRENIVRMVAGIFVLTGSLLAHFVNPSWIWLCVFVGINLLQSSVTKFCPLETILNTFNIGTKGNGSAC